MSLHSYRRPDEPSSCRLMDISDERRQSLHWERLEALGLGTGEIGVAILFQDEFNGGVTAADFDKSRMPPELQYDDYYEPHPSEQATLLEDELFWSVLEYMKEDARAIAHPGCSLKTARDWPVPSEKPDDWESVSWPNSASHIFYHKVGQDDSSPLRHIPFEPYRRLGFAIWCHKRMCCYGFMPSAWIRDEKRFMPNCFGRNSVFNAWKSILGGG